MLSEKALMPILERTFPFHYRWVTFYNEGTNWTVVYKEVKPAGMLSPGMVKPIWLWGSGDLATDSGCALNGLVTLGKATVSLSHHFVKGKTETLN